MKNTLYIILALLFCCCSRHKDTQPDYADMVKNYDFEQAHLRLSSDAEDITHSRGISEMNAKEEYVSNYYFVLKAEAEYLLSIDDPEFERLYLERLSDFDPEEYVNSSFAKQIGRFYKDKFNFGNEQYQKEIERYNNYCLSVMRKAMLRGRPELAQKIALLIRPDLVYTPVPENGKTVHVWSNAETSRQEAQRIINGNTQ